MTTIAQQVSRAIRILRGNRDESARASHLVVNNDQFVNNELLQVNQAEREKCSQSTFSERKIMSTKTAFKRVALVAAAALAFGGLSAVSAQASGSPDWTFTNNYVAAGVGQTTSTETVTQIAGVANYVTLNETNGSSGVYFTITGGALTTGATSGTATAAINVATPTVGTITVTSYVVTSGAASTVATSTTTITVIASAPGTVYNHSTSYLSTTLGSPALADSSSLTVSGATSGTAYARLTTTQYSTTDTTTQMNTANALAVTVAISGAGTVDTQLSGATRGPSATVIAGTAAVNDFYVFSNGVSGTATITVTINGVVASTKTFTFVGSLAKYILTAANTQKTNIGVGATGTLTITGQDSNGNAIATPSISTATSSDATIATTSVSGNVVTVTGVKSGTANITVSNGASTPITLVVPVVITKTTAAKVVLAFDAASYAAGDKITVTLTATDSNGSPVADGSYALLGSTGIAANVALVASTLPTAATVAIVGGTATYTAYAPDSTATVTLAAVEGAATDNVIAGNTAAAITATAQLTSPSADASNAATDAANEATDAANAATDAANAAADSADAATQAAQDAGDKADAALAAVTALSQQVTTLLAKVAALASTLAKITAAIAKLPKK